jgi:hypothetical protein
MNTKLEQLVTSGRCIRPTGHFWDGSEGTRKTGSAVSPKTLFLDLEHGTDQYETDRIHIVTYHDLIAALDLVVSGTRHEIIAVDPIEIAEKLLIGETCRQLKIDGLQGLPHGAAWQYLRENFDSQLMTRFSELRRSGRHVIVIGHSQVRTVTLPGLAEPFDRYEPRLDRQNAATLIEWSDHVLFFDWDIRTAKNRDGVVRALSGSEPIVRVVHGPSWTAKNRAGLTEPLKPVFDSLVPLFGTVTPERPGAGAAETTPDTPAAPYPPGSRTNLTESDEAPANLFLSDQEARTLEAFLADLPQERLLSFLRDRNVIGANDDYHGLGLGYARRILADLEGFKEVVSGG